MIKETLQKTAPVPAERLDFDFVVVGGGLAGCCAAIAAARHGLKTALVQDRAVLGGNASSEIRVAPFGAAAFHPYAHVTGIAGEVLDAERAMNHDKPFDGGANSLFDLAWYDACRREPNLTLIMNTSVRSVVMDGAAHVRAVLGVQLGTEKILEIHGKQFADCSGDGVVAYEAGAPYRIGPEAASEYGEMLAPEEASIETMGNSLLFRARDMGRPVPFEAPEWAAKYPTEESLALRDHRFVEGGYWWIEVGWPYDTIHQNEEIKHELMRHVLGVWDHIKNHCTIPGIRATAANYALDWFGAYPGKRESRRFFGDVVMTENDIRERRVWEDTVAFGGWFLDLHTTGGILAVGQAPEPSITYDKNGMPAYLKQHHRVTQLYGVPYRSLYCREIDNLFLGGRIISVSRVALGTTRVMETTAVMGEAVGVAAAICQANGLTPRGLAEDPKLVKALQQDLIKGGCFIPAFAHDDPADLALKATAAGTSEATLQWSSATEWVEMGAGVAELIPLNGRVNVVRLRVRNTADAAVRLTANLEQVGDVWTIEPGTVVAEAACTLAPGHDGWADFAFGVELSAGLYRLAVPGAAGVLVGQGTTVPTGTVRQFWKEGNPNWQPHPGHERIFVCAVEPAQRVYGAHQVIGGFTRPVVQPNLWVSDPAQALPQSLTLTWPSPVTANTVHLYLDNDVNRKYRDRGPFFRASQMAKDYVVEVRTADGQWQQVAVVRDNFQHRNVLHFASVTFDALRVNVIAAHGGPSARIYQVRVYAE